MCSESDDDDDDEPVSKTRWQWQGLIIDRQTRACAHRVKVDTCTSYMLAY